MERITADNCMNLLNEKFPKLFPYWEEFVNHWGLDEGITIKILPFCKYAVDVIKTNDEIEVKKIFDFVEILICYGDISVQSAITTTFLEYLLSKDPDKIKFSKFVKHMGKNSIDYCKAWDEFTGMKTEGLERKDMQE